MTRLARVVLALIVLATTRLATQHIAVAGAGLNVQVLATPGGQPDDITIDSRGRLVWGNLARGTVERLAGGRVVTVARGLSVPEGVVALHSGTLIVAEQGTDRITAIGPRGNRRVLYTLVPVPGQEGVDGIGYDPRARALLIPDSPRGTVLRFTLRNQHVRVLARGLGRPVEAAVDTHGNVLVPDEHLGTLVVITPSGHISYRGTLSTPDDVAVDRSGRIWVTTLGDGGLWSIAPHAAPRRILAGLASPQGLVLDRCGDPIVVEQNAARIIRLVLTAASQHCAL